MRYYLRILILVALTVLIFRQTNAQSFGYTTNSGMTIGFGLGASYQQSDIANSLGYGFDFWLGSHLYKKENSFLSADWKFRFLRGENFAHDHRMNTNGTFDNIRYDFFNYDFEFGLTLNRLRERTRIVISGFAGLGITHGRTFTDLFDENGLPYDYSQIDPVQEPAQIYADLLSLSDRKYETRLNNRAAVLPTLGIFLGYQFTRSFSMGIEHKTNFSLTERNSVFGLNMDNRVRPDSRMDRNHYTTLTFRWSLGGYAYGSYTRPSGPVPIAPPPPPVTSYTDPRPIVKITDPSSDSHKTTTNSYIIRARIQNVLSFNQIQFYQDGRLNENFNFYSTRDNFFASVELQEGTNTFRIVAANSGGRAEDVVTIILERPTVLVSPPSVNITVPSSRPHNTVVKSLEATARVNNVADKGDIQVVFNGQDIGFDYLATRGIVRTALILTEGINTLVVRAMNEAGGASDNVTILFNPPVVNRLPSVKITVPASPVTVQQPAFTIAAETSNLQRKEDLTLQINGVNTNQFNFYRSGAVSADILLIEGNNTVELIGTNEFGSSGDKTTIFYARPSPPLPPAPPVSPLPPVINLIAPGGSPHYTFESSENIRASILNVRGRENITFSVNGVNSGEYSYDSGTRLLNARISLNEGRNTIRISARNEAGQDSKTQVFIKEEKPCPLPALQLIEPSQSQSATNLQNHNIILVASNTKNVSVRFQGRNYSNFRFDPSNGQIVITLVAAPGSNVLEINAGNECGNANQRIEVNYMVEEPCISPEISIQSGTGINVDKNQYKFRAQVSHVKNAGQLTLLYNGANTNFDFSNNTVSFNATLKSGVNDFLLTAENECGRDSKTSTVTYTPAEEPCIFPAVNFTVMEVNRTDASHDLKGTVSNVKNKSEITLKVNGQADNSFQFVPTTEEITAKFKLQPGTHTIVVRAKNSCGEDTRTVSVKVEEPCISPLVEFKVTEVNRTDASHDLKGTVSNVKNKSEITLTVNGQPDNNFQFVLTTKEITAKFKLQPGTHTIVVRAKNSCGEDTRTVSVKVEEPCIPPLVNFTVTEVNRIDASHDLKGTVSNVKNKSEITLTVNGQPDNSFQFVPTTEEITAKFKLQPGTHTIVVRAKNSCGEDTRTVSVKVEEPCISPLVEFKVTEVNRTDASHDLKGTVSNVKNKSEITLTVNGQPDNNFQFVPTTKEITAKFKLHPGTHTIVVRAKNSCGEDTRTVSVKVEEPCISPLVEFKVTEVNRTDASHDLKGTVSNVKNKSEITLTVNGQADNSFQFVSATGGISAKFRFQPGTYTIVVAAKNACGSDSKSHTVKIEEKACGPRINPGNASWQFCLVTPSRTYNRDDLMNSNFTYSGPASSLYIMPIAGGGDVIVNGNPFTLRTGRYYLFEGNIRVTVSTKNPGSMGHWSVCIETDKAPVSGSGNSRPKSPCETSPETGPGPRRGSQGGSD
jgi:large repetitive protein